MESTKNRKKGLLSIAALIVCLAMLTVGTFAWFTDTATVMGNKVYAGNLSVDVVATVDEVLNAFAQDLYGTTYNNLSTAIADENKPSGVTGKSQKDVVDEKFDKLELTVAKDVEGVTGGLLGKKVLTKGTGSDGAAADGEVLATNAGSNYCVITNKEVPLIRLSNVEPGSSWPVSIDVMNSGELAISYAAGFSIEKNASETGLQALEAKYSDKNDPKYKALKKKLVAKQVVKKVDGTPDSYTPGGNNDLGGKLEDVLEVYAMSSEDIANYTNPEYDEHKAIMSIIPKGEDNSNYIGKITEIMHCNDADYLAKLDEKISTAEKTKNEKSAARDAARTAYDAIKDDPEVNSDVKAEKYADVQNTEGEYNESANAYSKLDEEKSELAGVRTRLAKAASGYCVPTDKIKGEPLYIYGKDGNNLKDGEGEDIVIPETDIGTAYFVIHMPGTAGDIYQNASLTLNVGVTANQVELDEDGIHVMVYDDQTARTTTVE